MYKKKSIHEGIKTLCIYICIYSLVGKNIVLDELLHACGFYNSHQCLYVFEVSLQFPHRSENYLKLKVNLCDWKMNNH